MHSVRYLLLGFVLVFGLATLATAQTAPPVLDPIGAQSVDENLPLTIEVTASDADATVPTLTTSTLPTGASFVDDGDGTGTLTWTPSFTDAGTFNVTFYANDIVTIDVDSELVVITVNNVNQAPILTAIGSQTGSENVLLTFGISASDADGATPTLTTSTLPGTAGFADNGNGTGTFTWTPSFTDAGTYSVTFYAGDGVATDSEVVSITIGNVNQAPILAAIGSQTGSENVLLTFGISAADADGTTPTLTTSVLPGTAGFADNGNGTGTFTWTPSFTDAGTYSVTFYAGDGVATDSEVVSITIGNVNQAPILAAIGSQTGSENVLLTFGISASDADGTTPTLTTSTLPGTAGFADNGNGTGTFTWIPSFTDAGTYSVTFYAGDGVATDSEVVSITIGNVNQAPILAAIGSQTGSENVLLTFGISASDADGATPTLTTSVLPGTAGFADNGNGTGTFTWTPGFSDAGTYSVTFYAGDGVATDSEVVSITIGNVNQAPILAAIGSQTGSENVLLTFGITAADADGTTPTLTTSTLPGTAAFTDNGNGTGTFTWTPSFTDAGTYSVTFYAGDGVATDSEVVSITIGNVNQAPILAAIGSQTGSENVLLTFGISASDADGATPTLTTSTLPGTAGFADNGNGTGTFTWTPSFSDAGTYSVTFYAGDGVATDSEVVSITIGNVNQAPILAAIDSQTGSENVLLTFGISASDADGTTPTLTTSVLPGTAGFADNGNGTGTFTWTPSFSDAGTYSVTFYAGDGVATDSEIVLITINNINRQPVLAAIGSQTVNENAVLTFGLSASDADLQTLAFSSTALPTHASLTDNGNGTASVSFAPDYYQAGTYNVTFYVTDGIDTDSELVAITVNNVNQLPVLAPIGPLFVTEGQNLNETITASDADGTPLTLTVTGLPANATYTDNGDGTAALDFNPSYTQADIISLRFYVSDGVAVDSELVFITINEAGNQNPVLAAIGNRTVGEDQTLSFTVNATDAEGHAPALTTTTLPANASFVDNGNGTGNFSFTPDFTQAGAFDITFAATDDSSAVDTETITITVNEAGNQAPILAAIGAQSVDENAVLSFGLSASDLDSPTLTFTSTALPTNATLTDNGNGTASFSFVPDFFQAGTYGITFYVSDGVDSDSELVTITVNNINRAPVLAAIGAQAVSENASLGFGLSAGDSDLEALSFTSTTLPNHATLTDNGNGTATFAFNPDYYQAGTYDLTFYVSDGIDTDSELVIITVNNVNQLPVLAAIGPLFVTEGQNLNQMLTATDLDGQPLVFTTSTLPANATFTDNGDGTAVFDFNPSYTQAQIISVRFYVTDGVAIDSELVFITIEEAGNQTPVLAYIGPRSTPENVNLTFNISAADADGTFPTLSADNLSTGASFVDNHNGTGTFNWTPTYEQEGVYVVTFIASDGQTADSELVTITVGGTNQAPIANAGPDQDNVIVGTLVTLDGSGSYDPDGGSVATYSWTQIAGTTVTLSDAAAAQPTFTSLAVGTYTFALIVSDGTDISAPDTVSVSLISGAPPVAVSDLSIQIVGDALQLSWSAVTLDTSGLAVTLDRYVVYRGASAYFTPAATDSIGSTDPLTLTFTDNNIGGANVVGDTVTNYFYVVQAVDYLGGRSVLSNRVGEFDYAIVTTGTSDYNLVAVPFTNTGITTADQLIAAIGTSNVLTVNNYVSSSQSFQSRFAAGFGVNFAVVPGGVYQVNAAAATTLSVAGRIPAPGTIQYAITTTATTDFNFLTIPFEREADFAVAQDVINNIPGVLNTLNNFVAGSQNYVSRFAAGFGTNFTVRAGKPYQANAAANGTFPQP